MRENDLEAAIGLEECLAMQRTSFEAARPESLDVRERRLTRAIAMLVDNADALSAAISEDFGQRSREQTLLTDILPAVGALKHARKHFRAWARDERRKPLFPLGLLGARAAVSFQPKGVVGIVSPWNFPISMMMTPLADIFAAGNRAMAKPSEFTEATADLLARLVPEYFAADEFRIVTGNASVAAEFARLPFDHLVFTGSTSIGRKVMASAAENLVPVTLELGGKSPVVVGRSAPADRTAGRIVMGKMINAGQTCLAPDYLLVEEGQIPSVVDAVSRATEAMYPSLLANPHYTSIINDRHYQRLLAHLDDARAKGARIVEINPGAEDFSSANCRKMPLTLLLDVDDDMTVMQEEIFGPLLPIAGYRRIEDAIDYVNRKERPLALYYFGADKAEEEMVVGRTHSGAVTLNDVVFHIAMDDLPFDGTGSSGMGHYHGRDGFRTFSHHRATYRQSPLDVAALAGFRPPFGKATMRAITNGLRL